MNTKINEFEVMAPVGSRESLAAAIQAGADSVYFGIGKLNMRSHSANHFTIDDLREIAATCNEHGIKTYLTVNTASGVFRYSTFRFFSHVAACNPDGSIILTIHIPINFIRFLL